MSSYVSFYIRNKNDFLPIGSFSRSSVIYQLAQNNCAPYEKIKAITINEIRRIAMECGEIKKKHEDGIKSFMERIDFLKECNASLSEREEFLSDYLETIEGYKEGIEEVEYAQNYYNFLITILEDVSYEENFDSKHYIYFGIDIGYNVKAEDIMGEKNILRDEIDVSEDYSTILEIIRSYLTNNYKILQNCDVEWEPDYMIEEEED